MAVIGWFIARSLKWTSLNEVYVRLAVGLFTAGRPHDSVMVLNEVYVRLAVGLSVFVLTGVTARGMGRE